MPRHDDFGIIGDAVLVRAVHPEWTCFEKDVERLTSATFRDGRQEASCFIENEVGGLEAFQAEILPVLSAEAGVTLGIATISASIVRAAGLWIYRKPEEFHDDPAHVVICPPDSMSKSKYAKSAGGLATEATLILPPKQSDADHRPCP
ncbi:MAG: hypothetical protein WCC26_10055 [Terracidiphilus sp.]